MNVNSDMLGNAKRTDIVAWLASQGYQPDHYRGCVAWYCSPLRGERTASFRVRTDINKWVDYGINVHQHDVIDLVMMMQDVDFKTAVDILNNGSLSLSRHTYSAATTTHTGGVTYENIRQLPLTSGNLLRYMASRGIRYLPKKEEVPPLCELHFNRPGGREQWHIGWRNDAGGYVVRRATDEPTAKCKKFNIGKTDITTIQHNSTLCYVFEGFFDYLSFVAMNECHALTTDAIVLNSVSNKQRAVNAIKASQYVSVGLLLDRDQAGNEATYYIAEQLAGMDVQDFRQCIAHGKDVNEELIWRVHNQENRQDAL